MSPPAMILFNLINSRNLENRLKIFLFLYSTEESAGGVFDSLRGFCLYVYVFMIPPPLYDCMLCTTMF